LNGRLSRLALAILFFLTLALDASAETVAETARKWGLIGSWSQDCSLPPDKDRGAAFAYEIAPGGQVKHRRDFGDTTDESEVVSAKVSKDGTLNLGVFFPNLKQTRQYGFVLQPDRTMRATYNRAKNEYTIKDSKFTADGNPTPALHKCN
jgi:hypothetical protein